MKVTLYMAISVNGLVAGEGDDTSWVSPEDFAGQAEVAKRIGNIIYGRRTYDIGLTENALPVPECLNVVVTNRLEDVQQSKDFLFTNKQPTEIIKELKTKEFSEVLVAGGSEINKLFIEQNLIDEIYVDIEPVLLGKGLPLFQPLGVKIQLELIESKMLNKSTIQLHYKVLK